MKETWYTRSHFSKILRTWLVKATPGSTFLTCRTNARRPRWPSSNAYNKSDKMNLACVQKLTSGQSTRFILCCWNWSVIINTGFWSWSCSSSTRLWAWSPIWPEKCFGYHVYDFDILEKKKTWSTQSRFYQIKRTWHINTNPGPWLSIVWAWTVWPITPRAVNWEIIVNYSIFVWKTSERVMIYFFLLPSMRQARISFNWWEQDPSRHVRERVICPDPWDTEQLDQFCHWL